MLEQQEASSPNYCQYWYHLMTIQIGKNQLPTDNYINPLGLGYYVMLHSMKGFMIVLHCESLTVSQVGRGLV